MIPELTNAGRELTDAGREVSTARQKLVNAMYRAAKLAEAANRDGTPETEIARALGVNRMTVRRWLGKL